eukprot:6197245-Pleurochrysis_carterae.AAC.1
MVALDCQGGVRLAEDGYLAGLSYGCKPIEAGTLHLLRGAADRGETMDAYSRSINVRDRIRGHANCDRVQLAHCTLTKWKGTECFDALVFVWRMLWFTASATAQRSEACGSS